MAASQRNSQEWDDAANVAPWLENEAGSQSGTQTISLSPKDLSQEGQAGWSSLQDLLRNDEENIPPELSVSNGQKASEPAQCPTCEKWFVSSAGLRQHSVLHTGEMPFVCTVCGKSFAFQSNLISHASVHDDNPPSHECPYCEKTCRLKENLMKHFKVHFKDEAERKQAWKEHFGGGERRSGKRAAAGEADDNAAVKPKKTKVRTAPRKSNRKRLGLKLEAGSDGWVQMVSQDEQFATLSVDAKVLLRCRQLTVVPLKIERQSQLLEVAVKKRMSFKDRAATALHETYHERVQLLTRDNEVKASDPPLMLFEQPANNDIDDEDEDEFLDAESQDGELPPALEFCGC